MKSVLSILPLSAITLALSTCYANAQSSQSASGDIENIEVSTVRQPFRGDVPPHEQPQNVQVVELENLIDASATTLQEALHLSSGVTEHNDFGGLWDSFAIRGLVGDENVPSGYMINGYTSGRGFSGTRDVSNIQRIEIMKGPGSALYGRSEPGGTINIITKKPQFSEQGYLQISAGSWDSYRAEGDYTNKLSDTLAIRVNGAYEDSNSFRDYLESDKTVITPSLLWQASDDTKINYEMEYVDQNTVFDRGIIAINGDIGALPIERFLGEPADRPTEVRVNAHQLTVEHTLGEWTLLTGGNYKTSSFISESSDAELAPARQLLFSDGRTLNRQHNERDFQTTDASLRVELSGSTQLAGVTHHLLIGADGYQFTFDRFWNRYRPGVDDPTYTLDVFNPVYGQQAPQGAVISNLREEQNSYGAYIQDQVDLSPHWKLQFGGRYDWFDQSIDNHLTENVSKQSQSTFSPRAGIVYVVSDALQYYATYSEGFRPNTGADINGNAFEPETTQSSEAGFKYSGNLHQASLAVFRANKSNMLTTDLNNGSPVALGEVESRGAEVDISGLLSEHTFYWLSYTFTDTSTANDMINPDWGVFIPEGSPLLNIPRHSASLTVKQELYQTGINADVGATVQYTGERLGETIDLNYVLPSYTLLNLFARYQVNQQTSIQLNLNNVLDKTYYANSYSAIWTQPGTPREARVSLRYEF